MVRVYDLPEIIHDFSNSFTFSYWTVRGNKRLEYIKNHFICHSLSGIYMHNLICEQLAPFYDSFGTTIIYIYMYKALHIIIVCTKNLRMRIVILSTDCTNHNFCIHVSIRSRNSYLKVSQAIIFLMKEPSKY